MLLCVKVLRFVTQSVPLLVSIMSTGGIHTGANLWWCRMMRTRVWLACLPLLRNGRTILNRVRISLVRIIGGRMLLPTVVYRLLSSCGILLGGGFMKSVLYGPQPPLLT